MVIVLAAHPGAEVEAVMTAAANGERCSMHNIADE